MFTELSSYHSFSDSFETYRAQQIVKLTFESLMTGMREAVQPELMTTHLLAIVEFMRIYERKNEEEIEILEFVNKL